MSMWRIAILPLILATPSAAQDSSGCDKFAWPIVTVQTQFSVPNIATVSAGTEFSSFPTQAFVLRLQPIANAKFMMPPEHPPKNENGFGGAVTFPIIERSGIYQITLSEEAWLDIIQNGQFARSVGSSGRRDCPGLRKSVRLELVKAPFVLQLSSVPSDSVKVSIIQVQ